MNPTFWARMHGGATHFPIALLMVSVIFDHAGFWWRNEVRRREFCAVGFYSFLGTVAGLAAIGIYGLMSYTVNQRTHEIGIRMALGAKRGEILHLVVRHGMILAIVGVVLGTVGALLLTRFLSSMLYGVGANDPTTLLSVATLLIGVAALASYIPARRAMRVDPMVALRHE